MDRSAYVVESNLPILTPVVHYARWIVSAAKAVTCSRPVPYSLGRGAGFLLSNYISNINRLFKNYR